MTYNNNYTRIDNIRATNHLTSLGYSYIDTFRPWFTSNGYYINQEEVDHGGIPSGRIVRTWDTRLSSRAFNRLLVSNNLLIS
jgi:hypothetical protein